MMTTPKIDAEIWKMYKHLGSTMEIDALPEEALGKYLMEFLPESISAQSIRNRITQIRRFRQSLHRLQQLPQVQQRSPEWYELRKNRLTASDMAQAMGKGKFGNRSQLVKKKAFPEDATFNANAAPLQWGVMFEPIASRSYSQRMNDMIIYDFGLIPHPTLDCFGASPDGISELGIMVEFKCPWRRKIDGNVLEQYEIQMQGQMAVCELEECHFVECDIQKLDSQQEYLDTVDETTNVDHGIIIEYPDDATKYIYSPEYLTPIEAIQWMNQVIEAQSSEKPYKLVYWKLRKYHMCCVQFDKQRWDAMVPSIQNFWYDVLEMRKVPKEKTKQLDFIDDDDDIS